MGYPGKVYPDETARSYEIKVKEMVEGERKALAGGVTKWGCTGTRGYVLIAWMYGAERRLGGARRGEVPLEKNCVRRETRSVQLFYESRRKKWQRFENWWWKLFFCRGGFKSCPIEVLCVLKDFRFSAVAMFWFCWWKGLWYVVEEGLRDWSLQYPEDITKRLMLYKEGIGKKFANFAPCWGEEQAEVR